MGAGLEHTINKLKACESLVGLRTQYEQACRDWRGDDAALFAIRECTCAAKERMEAYQLTERIAGNELHDQLNAA